MTALYLVTLVLASIGFGALLGAELVAIRLNRSDDLIARVEDYTMLDD